MITSIKFIFATITSLGLMASASADQGQYGMSLHDKLTTAGY